MFHWKPEVCYCHRLCTATAPFWFSTEHHWIVITPFWLSTDKSSWPLFSQRVMITRTIDINHSSMANGVQWNLVITRSLGPWKFVINHKPLWNGALVMNTYQQFQQSRHAVCHPVSLETVNSVSVFCGVPPPPRMSPGGRCQSSLPGLGPGHL